MKFSAERENILAALQAVTGVVERRQTMPILANVLLSVRQGKLLVTATDLEVELVAEARVDSVVDGEITVPGRKLFDICRSLPEKVVVQVSLEGDKVTVKAGRSRFSLSSLPAGDFPIIDEIHVQQVIEVGQDDIARLIDKTEFSMAQQDVRYYLNGMLLETDGKMLRTVATDGHRLAMCEMPFASTSAGVNQVIVPRKGVHELKRILNEVRKTRKDDAPVAEGSESAGTGDRIKLTLSNNHLRAQIGSIRFTSKLIDGRFPDYSRVIPASPPRTVVASRDVLKAALQRTAILSNEKYRGIRLAMSQGLLKIQAHNPEQEEAEDEVEVNYNGEAFEVGFNVTYLLNALEAIEGDQVEVGLTDSNSSCLVKGPGSPGARYVVMPMRL
ncbi:MAG: DNA polymerase III subunit beta [Gammaproteobacteria bacterium]|nr:DNA polymerase III subunit beta [Gammaproteobacteria bacterium]